MRLKTSFLAILLLFAYPILAEVKLESDGLLITIEEKSPELPGYASFLVTVKNQTQTPKTLHGQIRLTWDTDNKSEDRGGCIVYAEVRSHSENQILVPCKYERYNMWMFQLIKIYNFIQQSYHALPAV